VAGWLHTEISVRHRELNPDMVARRRLTTMPDHRGRETTGYIIGD